MHPAIIITREAAIAAISAPALPLTLTGFQVREPDLAGMCLGTFRDLTVAGDYMRTHVSAWGSLIVQDLATGKVCLQATHGGCMMRI